jgi:hypothetical protein
MKMRKWINVILENTDKVDRALVARSVYDRLDWDSASGEDCLRAYADDMDIEVDDDLEMGEIDAALGIDRNSPEFKDWFSGWVESNYEEAEYDILSRVQNHHITLWRYITAPKDWTPEGRHPGIYWSYIQEAAHPHWGGYGEGDVGWMMQATVPVSAIDWETTLVMSGQPDFEEEKEIRLLEGAPVTVEKYWMVDKG